MTGKTFMTVDWRNRRLRNITKPLVAEEEARLEAEKTSNGGQNLPVHLDVSSNQLQRFDLIDSLGSITQLHASGNHLHRLISLLPVKNTLTALDISQNQITSLDGLNQLHHLVRLNLANNLIQTIPMLDRLHQLMELNLSGNQLEASPNLSKLTNLRSLNLSDNKMINFTTKTLPRSVEHLYLSDNHLKDLSQVSGIQEFDNLDLLTIDGNPMVREKRAFDYRPYIISLALFIRTIDGFVVSDPERLKGEWMYSQGKARKYGPGNHVSLCSYLTQHCPLVEQEWDGSRLSTPLEQQVMKVLRVKQEEADNSRQNSPLISTVSDTNKEENDESAGQKTDHQKTYSTTNKLFSPNLSSRRPHTSPHCGRGLTKRQQASAAEPAAAFQKTIVLNPTLSIGKSSPSVKNQQFHSSSTTHSSGGGPSASSKLTQSSHPSSSKTVEKRKESLQQELVDSPTSINTNKSSASRGLMTPNQKKVVQNRMIGSGGGGRKQRLYVPEEFSPIGKTLRRSPLVPTEASLGPCEASVRNIKDNRLEFDHQTEVFPETMVNTKNNKETTFLPTKKSSAYHPRHVPHIQLSKRDGPENRRRELAAIRIQAWYRGIWTRTNDTRVRRLLKRLAQQRALSWQYWNSFQFSFLQSRLDSLESENQRTQAGVEELQGVISRKNSEIQRLQSSLDSLIRAAVLPVPGNLSFASESDSCGILMWELIWEIPTLDAADQTNQGSKKAVFNSIGVNPHSNSSTGGGDGQSNPNRFISGYRIFVDEEPCGEVSNRRCKALIADLEPGVEHSVKIEALPIHALAQTLSKPIVSEAIRIRVSASGTMETVKSFAGGPPRPPSSSTAGGTSPSPDPSVRDYSEQSEKVVPMRDSYQPREFKSTPATPDSILSSPSNHHHHHHHHHHQPDNQSRQQHQDGGHNTSADHADHSLNNETTVSKSPSSSIAAAYNPNSSFEEEGEDPTDSPHQTSRHHQHQIPPTPNSSYVFTNDDSSLNADAIVDDVEDVEDVDACHRFPGVTADPLLLPSSPSFAAAADGSPEKPMAPHTSFAEDPSSTAAKEDNVDNM